MEYYFKNFSSNSCAGSGNQLYFTMDKDEVRTGRVFYKISAGGKYNYSILFSNTIDSTYADGKISRANLVCESWKIHRAKIGVCSKMPQGDSVLTATMQDENNTKADICPANFKPLLFNGSEQKIVAPGEFFYTDSVEMEFKKDEYLCLEITFSGNKIPYHEETLLPVYVKTEGGWKYSKYMPFASMIGCNRKVENTVGFWGDSITQGCGTKRNGYLHWNSVLAKKLSEKNSYWNLGIGYARADDAATEGAWFLKTKNCDVVFVCFGVNDIMKGYSEKDLKNNLEKIVKALKRSGKIVVVQTIPPFNYDSAKKQIWENVNEFIKNDIAKICDGIFNNVPILGDYPQNPHIAVYGGHPNDDGCQKWADALFEYLSSVNNLKTLLI